MCLVLCFCSGDYFVPTKTCSGKQPRNDTVATYFFSLLLFFYFYRHAHSPTIVFFSSTDKTRRKESFKPTATTLPYDITRFWLSGSIAKAKVFQVSVDHSAYCNTYDIVTLLSSYLTSVYQLEPTSLITFPSLSGSGCRCRPKGKGKEGENLYHKREKGPIQKKSII